MPKEVISLINICEPNTGPLKYVKQILRDIKGELTRKYSQLKFYQKQYQGINLPRIKDLYFKNYKTLMKLKMVQRNGNIANVLGLQELIWLKCPWASLVAHMVKNLPETQETQVQSLGWEDPLEKEIATHSSILALRIPGDPGRLQSMGLQRVRHNIHTTYPNQSTDLMQSLSKHTRYVSQN